jgi:hypothetical protein
MDWIDLAQEGSCGHGNESLGTIKCWEVLEWLHCDAIKLLPTPRKISKGTLAYFSFIKLL